MASAGARPVVQWPPSAAAVCVGYSGGLDSTVLLHLLHEHAQARALTAVHVHHGLSPNADQWAQSCARTCERLRVPLQVVRVDVDRRSPLGIEGEARRLRYDAYAARPEPFVALAHHLDDQAETVLLQLLRGTGLKGVAAMPVLRALSPRVTLWRPLLAYRRGELEAHARREGLEWVDDESNRSPAHDRNFLRHDVAPLLDARFPEWRRSLARFATHAASADELLEALATIDGVPAARGETLRLERHLAASRRANVLRAYLARNGLAMASEARLAEMARQLYEAREDAVVRLEHDGIVITRHRGRARLEAPLPAPWRVPWRGEADVRLGDAIGAVHFEPVTGAGLRREARTTGEWFFAPRAGGERIRLAAGRPTRTLKNLLQESGFSPGERARLPLLFHGERLVWVPGIGIAAEYACGAAENGLQPRWDGGGEGVAVLE
jgi:tRNA(Ile)-lysidine synthase